jgi:DNA-binding XRE family transcriptional regulator
MADASLTTGQPGLSGPLPAPTPSSTGPATPWTTAINGQRLRQLRRHHGLSREELAGRAGLSLATVARLERDLNVSCRCRTLTRLATALHTEPAWLVPPREVVRH